MGQIFRAVCKCGYENSQHVLLGAGMMDFDRSCLVPARCAKCKSILSVELLRPQVSCPDCRVAVELLVTISPASEAIDGDHAWKLPDGRHVVLADPPYECPRCGRPALQLHHTGSFD
jgi:DNA-directed RNA polymerase subunit RPC12/RpoP